MTWLCYAWPDGEDDDEEDGNEWQQAPGGYVAAAPHVQLGCVRRGPAPGHDAGVGLSPVPDEPAHWSQRTDTVVSWRDAIMYMF